MMGIPESILKKLIVPGSFRKGQDEFSIILNNTFAPATVSSFKVLVDGEPLSGESISLSSATQGAIKASDIKTESPVVLKVKEDIKIIVKKRISNESIRIFATTREVGDIEFSISPSSKTKGYKPLKPGIFDNLKKPRQARVSVDPEKSIGAVSPLVFGHFIEHLEHCIYGGIWTDDGSQLRTDTLELIKELHPSIIRYPGGNFASGYHWEDGVGPRSKRPARHDAAWQAEESNQVGTDEFLAFCESINTVPYLVVNDGSGTPEEAARWVEYCNGSASTPQGKRRAENGRIEPYRVKYWGVGNEVWGPWQIGTTTAENYSKRLNRFAQAMRAVDPDIEIIAVGHNPLTDAPDDPAAVWNRIVLQNSSQYFDYLSWHIYQPEKQSWQSEYNPLDLFRSVSSAHLDLEEILLRVEKQIQQYAGKPVLQAVDEWNLWLPPVENNVSMHNVTYTMRDALYVTSALATFAKHNKTVGMANLAQMVNVLPLIKTNPGNAIRTAIFYPFVLFNSLPTELLQTSEECETFSSEFLDTNVKAHTNVPFLDSIAGFDEEKKEMGLILVNRYPLEKLNVRISFPGMQDYHPVEAVSIYAGYPEASNNFDHPDEVRLTPSKLPSVHRNDWNLTMKPCSVTMVKFRFS